MYNHKSLINHLKKSRLNIQKKCWSNVYFVYTLVRTLVAKDMGLRPRKNEVWPSVSDLPIKGLGLSDSYEVLEFGKSSVDSLVTKVFVGTLGTTWRQSKGLCKASVMGLAAKEGLGNLRADMVNEDLKYRRLR